MVVKKLWDYIKSNDLQNPDNRREILCDDKLRALFNADKVHMFTMNKVEDPEDQVDSRYYQTICGRKQMLSAGATQVLPRIQCQSLLPQPRTPPPNETENTSNPTLEYNQIQNQTQNPKIKTTRTQKVDLVTSRKIGRISLLYMLGYGKL